MKIITSLHVVVVVVVIAFINLSQLSALTAGYQFVVGKPTIPDVPVNSPSLPLSIVNFSSVRS